MVAAWLDSWGGGEYAYLFFLSFFLVADEVSFGVLRDPFPFLFQPFLLLGIASGLWAGQQHTGWGEENKTHRIRGRNDEILARKIGGWERVKASDTPAGLERST